MRLDEQIFEEIETYLAGKMPLEERRAFEARVGADRELAALVEQHRLERKGLELLVERDLMRRMQDWEVEAYRRKSGGGGKQVRMLPWIMRVAALIVFLLGAVWVFRTWQAPDEQPIAQDTTPLKKQTTPNKSKNKPRGTAAPTVSQAPEEPATETGPADDNDEAAYTAVDPRPQTTVKSPQLPNATADYGALADNYYRDLNSSPRPRTSGGGVGDALYDRSLRSFQDGDNDEVIRQLKPVLELTKKDGQRQELLAHALYREGRYEEALAYFRTISASGDNTYAQRADWMMVLTLLHQMPAKRPLLERVLERIESTPGHPYRQQAAEVRGRL